MKESTFWQVTVPRLMSSYAVLTFAVMWIGLAIALAVNPGWLDQLWNWVGKLPAAVEILIWVVLLPIMVGLWIWESTWSTLPTLLALAGLVGWTLLAVSSLAKAVGQA